MRFRRLLNAERRARLGWRLPGLPIALVRQSASLSSSSGSLSQKEMFAYFPSLFSFHPPSHIAARCEGSGKRVYDKVIIASFIYHLFINYTLVSRASPFAGVA